MVNFGLSDERTKARVFIPFYDYIAAMEFQTNEALTVLVPHAVSGLSTEELIGNEWAFGSGSNLVSFRVPPNSEIPGIVYDPSPSGIELFL